MLAISRATSPSIHLTQSSAEDLYKLALSYKRGAGVPQNEAHARSLLEQAADLKFTKAIALLGAFLLDGLGGPKDLPRAIQLFIQAAEAGDTTSKLALVYYYENGIEVPKDPKRAVDLLEESARGGNREAQEKLGIAYYKMGYCYEWGAEGLPVNYDLAVDYYRKGAAHGYLISIRCLGLCYCHEIGVERDHQKANLYFTEATTKGDLRSFAYLGILHYYGLGVPEDKQQAYQLFLQGQADGGCMYWLGICAEEGIGQDPNPQLALDWFRRSMETYHQWKADAQKKLNPTD